MIRNRVTPFSPLDDRGQVCCFRPAEVTLGRYRDPEQGLRPGLHLETVDQGAVEDVAGYYIQASEAEGSRLAAGGALARRR